MTNGILNLTARVEAQAERIRMALGKADLNNVDAEAATAEAGYKIPRNRIKQLRDGTTQVKDLEIAVLATVCGVDEAMIRGDAYLLPDFRGLNEATPGYVNSDADRDRLSRRILNPDHSERVDHELGGCVDCATNPDFHVALEWMTPGGNIPGQTELVLDIEKMLEEVA